ncbi:hypothetical protein [Xylanimonas sp. McL0601]|uniref:hypothetical protein n=1 Tax=Xylanimonas sp. McL0601 TaxID=3414739 RepID=UPI003CF6F0C9
MHAAFLTIGIVATAIALLALIFDGTLEALDVGLPGDGSVSVLALSGGLGAFGWAGLAVSTLTDLPDGAVLLAAAGVGVVITAGAAWLTGMLRRQSTPDGAGSVSGLVGVDGVMDTPAGPGKPGVVRVSYAGSPRTMTAHTTTEIAAGALVTVAAVVSGDVVRVAPAGA